MTDIESYFFETEERVNEHRYFVVICYDIINNKRRYRFAKLLEHYAMRVQRSVFEGELSKNTYEELIRKIDQSIDSEDNVRVYRISGNGEIKYWGKEDMPKAEEVIII